MLKALLLILSSFLLVSLGSCHTHTHWYGPPLTVQTLSLFNQRTDVLKGSKKSWKGDWIFRRQRLKLIDENLNESSPNIVFFQELMTKNNKADSDATILEYSSLAYHDPFKDFIKSYQDTNESEFAASYIRIGSYKASIEEQHPLVQLKGDGYLVFKSILINKVPFYLVNIRMGEGDLNELYDELIIQLQKHLDEIQTCYNQIIIAGHFKGQTHSQHYNRFVRAFNLIDTAWNFCEMNKNCYTESPSNPILSSSTEKSKIYRSERILTHKTSKVFSSQIAFTQEKKTLSEFKKKYNLHTLTPSSRYGWQAKISFGICLNRDARKPMKGK